MYDGMRATGKWAALYFIALMAVGYYVLFNLLVAILVEGFTNSGVRYNNCPNIINYKHLTAFTQPKSAQVVLTQLNTIQLPVTTR